MEGLLSFTSSAIGTAQRRVSNLTACPPREGRVEFVFALQRTGAR